MRGAVCGEVSMPQRGGSTEAEGYCTDDKRRDRPRTKEHLVFRGRRCLEDDVSDQKAVPCNPKERQAKQLAGERLIPIDDSQVCLVRFPVDG